MTTAQFQPPSPLQPAALIDSADYAVNNPPPGGPSRETIHRAISTVYYAVFHAITASNATVQHGVPTNTAAARAWTNTYRRMRHNPAANRLKQHLFHQTQNVQTLANGFINLMNVRETADYDPNRALTTAEANYWIGVARNALIALQAMTQAERETMRNITLRGYP